LHEFLNQKRKYIAAIYDDETQVNLRKWCTDNGFDLSKKFKGDDQKPEDFIFHTTIMYSETIHDLPNGKLPLTKPFLVKPFAFELLGEDKDIPVMKVDGHGLYKARESYVEDYEMRDRWSSYLPHVSLSYVRDASTDFSKIKLPKFKLWVNRIDIEDIDADV
jgi:hypothetical protein